MNKLFTTRNMARMAALSALAFVLQFVAFPILPHAPFLKVDFADVPVVLAGFAINPLAGVIVSLCKNLLQLPFSSTSMIGELSNFIQGSTFVGVSTLVYRVLKGIRGAVVALVIAVFATTIMACFTNFFIMLPLYLNVTAVDVRAGLILSAILPFNGIKFTLESIAVFLLYKHVRFLLKDYKKESPQPTASSDTPSPSDG